MIFEAAVLDTSTVLAWLGIGGVASAEHLDVARASVTTSTIDEIAQFLALRYEGNPPAALAQTLALEWAPMTVYPPLPLLAETMRYYGELANWSLAAAIALAQAQHLPLITVHAAAHAVEVPGLTVIRWWLLDQGEQQTPET